MGGSHPIIFPGELRMAGQDSGGSSRSEGLTHGEFINICA